MRLSKEMYENIRIMICEGKLNAEICSKLNVLETQVEYQRKKIAKEQVTSNIEILKNACKHAGLTFSSASESINNLDSKSLQKVVDKIGFSSGDVHITMNNQDYVVEYWEDDEELSCDFTMKTRREYEEIFGEIYPEDWEGQY